MAKLKNQTVSFPLFIKNTFFISENLEHKKNGSDFSEPFLYLNYLS